MGPWALELLAALAVAHSVYVLLYVLYRIRIMKLLTQHSVRGNPWALTDDSFAC